MNGIDASGTAGSSPGPWNRLCWAELDAAARTRSLARPVQAVARATTEAVAAVVDAVRERGDAALRELTARFDRVELESFEVTAAEFAAAEAMVAPDLRQAMTEAAARIEAFHRAGMATGYALETAPGVVCERIIRPVPRVGLYVPAGSAPLPSTALMLCVPARLAGVERVFKLGGAQAIAALAYGTDSVPRVDKIFGPGNSYVDEAKRQVAQCGAAAIDMPAGPSEVLVIADDGADPAFVAADLLSQAEHGPDSQVLLLSDSAGLIGRVEAELALQLAALPRAQIARQALSASRLIQVQDLEQAFEISNAYAPEHLILALRQPRSWLDRVEAAGSVFLGDWTPEALGDYCSGTNHVLPTNGAARAWSGVSVASFQNFLSVQAASREGIAAIGACAVTMARAEQLDAHANAVALRLRGVAA